MNKPSSTRHCVWCLPEATPHWKDVSSARGPFCGNSHESPCLHKRLLKENIFLDFFVFKALPVGPTQAPFGNTNINVTICQSNTFSASWRKQRERSGNVDTDSGFEGRGGCRERSLVNDPGNSPGDVLWSPFLPMADSIQIMHYDCHHLLKSFNNDWVSIQERNGHRLSG